MPRIRYAAPKLRASSLGIIAQANKIIGEYIEAGFKLTLRQLYYQFVARGLMPNRQTEYKRLGSIINDGRLAGLIDWEAIEDRGRNLITSPAWESPQSILNAVAEQFRFNPWLEQDHYVEVWVEKEALIGVLAVPCEKWRVPYFACKGYPSASEVWAAGHFRLRRQAAMGKEVHIFHLGDHDPSGIDMTRDIEERLSLFSRASVDVQRLALNMDQVEEWNPPPNPAKVTDSRFESYAAEHGDESWELDALNPETIADLIGGKIEELVDMENWDSEIEREEGERARLAKIAERYDDV